MTHLHLRRWIIIGLTSATVCSTSWAATLIKRDLQGKTETVIMERQKIRIQSPNPNSYALMHLDKGKTYMVDATQKRIVEMDIVGKPPQVQLPKDMPKPPWGNSVRAKLVKQSGKLDIAGYSTEHYQIEALGKACFDVYFSKKAAWVDYVEDFLNASYEITNSRKIKGMPLHPCQKAHEDLEKKIKRRGIPMKFVMKGNSDQIIYEVTNIRTGVRVSADVFALPTGYKMISEQDWMTEREAKMNEWREKNKGTHTLPSRE